MDSIMYILIVLAVILITAWLCYRHIRSMANNLLAQGLACTEGKKRNALLRKAALMCNEDAIIAYACNNPDMFTQPKLVPFKYSIGLHRFPCVFADHYFAKGLYKLISPKQKAFMKRVYAFDGLEEDCEDLIEEGIKNLGVSAKDAVIIFMPCSNPFRFTNKFQHLSWKLQKKGYEVNHMTYPYHSVRDQKDNSSSDEDLMSHVSEIVGVDKRKVIVVDDVFNTGRTLKTFCKELKKYHAQIVGAVFVSKVFYPPKNMLLTWIKIVLTEQK